MPHIIEQAQLIGPAPVDCSLLHFGEDHQYISIDLLSQQFSCKCLFDSCGNVFPCTVLILNYGNTTNAAGKWQQPSHACTVFSSRERSTSEKMHKTSA